MKKLKVEELSHLEILGSEIMESHCSGEVFTSGDLPASLHPLDSALSSHTPLSNPCHLINPSSHTFLTTPVDSIGPGTINISGKNR